MFFLFKNDKVNVPNLSIHIELLGCTDAQLFCDYYKDPNTTENLKDIDLSSTSSSDKESTPEDGSFAVVIIAAVVAFFLFLLFR